jgi:hypothetical protein
MQDDIQKQVAADLGIAELPPESQKEIIAQFGEVALKAATMAVMEKLTDASREEFMHLAQAGDPTALQAFLDREVPGHEALAKAAVAEEVRLFKEASKAGA